MLVQSNYFHIFSAKKLRIHISFGLPINLSGHSSSFLVCLITDEACLVEN